MYTREPQPRPLLIGALVSGGVRENGPAYFRCSAFVIGFVLPNQPLCIDVGCVANVPQNVLVGLGWVALRCFRGRGARWG